MKALQYVEIDLDHCSLTYSVAPCQASLTNSPPTGTKKCFNTPATCQDRANYTNVPITMRFAMPTDYLPATIDAIPNIKQISFSPGAVSLGQNLGQRSALTITFEDHRHSDTGVGGDPYLADRAYNPYSQGTFLAKFRARNRFLSGRPLRWINGEVGQTLGEMETRHYIIDSYSGPNNNGEFTITAKDILQLADDDKSLAPVTTNAQLAADITNTATSLSMTPSGAGRLFPHSGYVALAGSEIAAYEHVVGYANGSNPNAVAFSGDRLARGAGLTGAADSQKLTIAGWIKRQSSSINSVVFSQFTSVGGGAAASVNRLVLDASGNLFFSGMNSGGTIVCSIKSALTSLPNDVWKSFLISFDLSDVNKKHFYIDDVSSLVTNTFTVGQTLDLTQADFSVGAYADNNNQLTAEIADLWISFGTYIDFSVAANRRLFVDSDMRPVPLGSNGQTPTGSSPIVFLANPAASFQTNLGTGGGFTLTGTLTTGTFGDGDSLRLTARGQLNTTAAAHSTDDRVQLVLQYINQDPAVIIRDLLVNYTDIDASFIPISDWLVETQTYLGRLYTATIATPTGVATLISELVEQAGLIFWWDDLNQQIGLAVIRGAVAGSQEFNADNTLADSLNISDQPDKRLSQVHTYFAQINPLTSLTDKNNFRSVAVGTAAQAEADYGTQAIKEIFSRWIPLNGRAAADAINSLLLARFQDPPRHFKFQQLRGVTDIPELARTYNVAGWPLQTDEGAADLVPVQITRVKPLADIIEIEGDELLFSGADTNIRNITFDASSNNVNARTAHDLLYTTPVAGNVINIVINSGVVIGASTTSARAFDVGSWPAGVTVNLTVYGRIQGAGGQGGAYFSTPTGGAGGTALYTRQAITLIDATGEIWGGGGGGGAGLAGSNDVGGGGGAGTLPGIGGGSVAGFPGAAGTATAGGAPGFVTGGAAGGNPGLAGGNGNIGNGGAAGPAIDGISFITTSGSAGDRRGSQIN